jgi:hypothetical protein
MDGRYTEMQEQFSVFASVTNRYAENAGAILCPWMDGTQKMQEQFSVFASVTNRYTENAAAIFCVCLSDKRHAENARSNSRRFSAQDRRH